jgi:hypothetical protein
MSVSNFGVLNGAYLLYAISAHGLRALLKQ